MRIDLDTYKDGKLNYGAIPSKERNDVWEWRWSAFRSLFVDKYPELVIMLGNINSFKAYCIVNNIFTLQFKYSNKLGYGLRYQDMEIVTNFEFKKILKKFSRYLQCTQETYKIKTLGD